MKKVLSFLLVLLLVTACGNSKDALKKEQMDLYQSFWTVIQDQEGFQSSSSSFTIKANYAEGKYEVVIDQARLAMTDVKVLVIENDALPSKDKVNMPSAGIFEDSVDMIPNQTQEGTQFASEVRLSNSATAPVKLNILVQWRSLSTNEIVREFFEFNLDA